LSGGGSNPIPEGVVSVVLIENNFMLLNNVNIRMDGGMRALMMMTVFLTVVIG
jgi:hypothetical protein